MFFCFAHGVIGDLWKNGNVNNLSDKSQWTQQELIQLLETGENGEIEFKISFDREAIETLSAFANTRGGSILIGVDDNGAVRGIDLGRETLQNWNNQIKQAFQQRKCCFRFSSKTYQ